MSGTAKTSGNKKTSGSSSSSYWARAKTGGFAETHRAKRIKRHEKRMGCKAGILPPDFPRLSKPRPVEKVVDRSNVTEGVLKMHLGGTDRTGRVFPGSPLYQGYSAGVLLEQGFSLSSVNSALDGSIQERHVYIQHPTGRKELLSYSPGK